MNKLSIVTIDNLHASIIDFITSKEKKVEVYDDMKEIVLEMIKEGSMFSMDRDRLRDAMEDLTFMLNPDLVNKERVEKGLEYDDDEDDDDDDELFDMEQFNEFMNAQMKEGMGKNKSSSEEDDNEEDDSMTPRPSNTDVESAVQEKAPVEEEVVEEKAPVEEEIVEDKIPVEDLK